MTNEEIDVELASFVEVLKARLNDDLTKLNSFQVSRWLRTCTHLSEMFKDFIEELGRSGHHKMQDAKDLLRNFNEEVRFKMGG